MKKATVLVSFLDLEEGVQREPADVFSVKDDRGEYLAGLGFVSLEDEKPKRKPAAKKKK